MSREGSVCGLEVMTLPRKGRDVGSIPARATFSAKVTDLKNKLQTVESFLSFLLSLFHNPSGNGSSNVPVTLVYMRKVKIGLNENQCGQHNLLTGNHAS